jgi:hypothetical protein
MNLKLEAAREYARRKWRVIPLHNITADGGCSCRKGAKCPTAGKHPRHDKWQDAGSTSIADVQTWWDERPDANIGIVTDRRSDIWALDVDPEKGGLGSLQDLVDEHGPLPETRLHATGSGGVHYIFTYPDDYDIPTTSSSLGVGIDTRGAGNGQIVVPPSATDKGPYWVIRDVDPLPAPRWLLDRLREITDLRAKGTEADVVGAEPLDIDALPAKLRTRLTLISVDDRSSYFHGTVAACRRSGLTQGQTVTALSYWCAAVGKFTGRVASEVARSWGKLSDADPAHDPDRYVAELERAERAQTPEHHPVRAMFAELVEMARVYQDLPDPSHLAVTLAVAATRDVSDDPVWLLLVAPPSSGKTESVRMLDACSDAHLDDVTGAGLLSWKGSGTKAQPTGVLTRVPDHALVTFGDLSTLLADSDKGRRDQTFGILRRAYDGHVTRDLGTAPAPLSWKGKLTVVGAVTGVIDNYAVHADALGPRWIYYRLPLRSNEAKRSAAKMARSPEIRAARGEVAKLAAQIVYKARAGINTYIPDEVADAIEDAALVTCWGRASVPRNGYGRREIDGVPIVEEPPRVIRQLRGLAVGLYAIGLTDIGVEALCRRVALDSMPVARRQALEAVCEFPGVSTSRAAGIAGLHRMVAGRHLEELELIGVVRVRREGEEPVESESDRRPAFWSLTEDEGVIIKRVFDLEEASHMLDTSLTRKVGLHPPSPPYRGQNGQIQDQSAGGVLRDPTYRVTPGGAT